MSDDQYSEVETKKRMENAIRKAQKTPPQPHKDIVVKKGKSPKAKAPKGRNFRHQGR
jgi:hypothetical protein